MLITKTYTGAKLEPFMDPESAVTEAVAFGNSLTIAKGTILGQVTAGSKFAVYASGNSNGTEVAKAIAMYDFTTDGSGNVTIGGDTSVAYQTAPVYLEGYFRTTELTGLDATAVTALGKIKNGTIADGVIYVS